MLDRDMVIVKQGDMGEQDTIKVSMLGDSEENIPSSWHRTDTLFQRIMFQGGTNLCSSGDLSEKYMHY